MKRCEDAVRRDLETRRIADWSTPLSQASHDQQSGLGYGLSRKLGLTGLAEPTRTLPDGSIMPNPELGGDRAEFDKAIDGSLGTKEAKEKARGEKEKKKRCQSFCRDMLHKHFIFNSMTQH